jgi:TonB family protein
MQELVLRWRGRGRVRGLSLSVLSVPTLMMALLALPLHAQIAGDRTVITRIQPEYPDTLKRLYIGGAVRVEAIVAPNGTVESTQLIGGNPILGQTAMRAIKQWKFAPAKAKQALIVKVEFDPHR